MTGWDPLAYLISEYTTTILTESFRLRIRTRESAGHFPFSIHNIYRVLLAIAEPFYEGFALLSHRLDFNDLCIQAAMGTPSRVFRYFHVVIAGAYQPQGAPIVQRMQCLKELAGPIARHASTQLLVPDHDQLASARYFTLSSAQARLVATLAVYLREFVDYAFLGQHDQGFVCYPAVHTPLGALVVRRFHHLPSPAVAWKAINIYTCYDEGAMQYLRYDRFRGDIEGLPGPEYLRYAVAVAPDTQHILTSGDIGQTLLGITQGFADKRKLLSESDPVTIEQELCLLFSSELLGLLELAGENTRLWRERFTDAVIRIHSAKSPPKRDAENWAECFTDMYLMHLRRAIEAVEREMQDE